MSQTRQRRKQPKPPGGAGPRSVVHEADSKQEEAQASTDTDSSMNASSVVAAWRRQPLWMVLAVASGACAAFNGVFAKLTTTSLTSNLSSSIATFFDLSPTNTIVDILVRATFFALNLAFNALMWGLFTSALTRAESTTRVSIINVSANFVVTAMLGWMIFGEKLPGLWWLGAGMLAVGNVVIGRREERELEGKGQQGERGVEAERLMRGSAEEGDLVELDGNVDAQANRDDREEQRRLQDVDAPV